MFGKPVRVTAEKSRIVVSGIPKKNTIHFVLRDEFEFAVLHSPAELAAKKGLQLHIGLEGDRAIKAKINSVVFDGEKMAIHYSLKDGLRTKGHIVFDPTTAMATMRIIRSKSDVVKPVRWVDVERA